MAQLVVNTAQVKCMFGTAPSALMILPANKTIGVSQPAATIMDYIPFTNILPFLMCTTPSNPAVVAAQGAPVPCTPIVPAPWVPGSPTVMIGGKPALNSSSMCMCAYGGTITVVFPGQVTVNVP